MRTFIRCIVIAIAAFSMGFGMILATAIVMGGDMKQMESVIRPILAVLLVLGGMICGSGAFCLGAPRFELRSPCIELCVGAIFGGFLPSLSLAGPDFPPGAMGLTALGIAVFFLFEVYGYRLAERILPRSRTASG